MRLIKYCIQVILVWLVFIIPARADIGIRIDNVSGVVGDIVTVPVYVDTSLTTLNVFSYQLEIKYNTYYMEALEPEFAGTLSSSWGTPVSNIAEAGKIFISHAGTTALSGTGVIANLRFRLKVHGTSYVELVAGDKTIFNEGDIPLFLTNGRITISPKPYLSFYPNGAFLFIGETVQYSASQGTAPYTWGTTDPSVATINSSGLVTGVSPGKARVIAQDAVGVIDTSGYYVEVVPFLITIRDTSYFQNNYIDIPVNISSLDNFNVYGGEVTVTYQKAVLNAESVILTGSILNAVPSTSVNVSQPGIVNVSFASANKVTGSGPLFYIRFKIANIPSGYSAVDVTHAVFNEILKVKDYPGRFGITPLPPLHVSPTTGELFVGESMDFNVTGGITPYIWSVSDNSIATIDNNGLLTALAGGSVVVSVSDPRGSTGRSQTITVYEGTLDVGDVSIPVNETTVTIPITLTAENSITPIISLSGSVLFNQNKINSISSNNAGTATTAWAYSDNSEDDHFNFAGAGTSGITGNATMLYLDVNMGSGISVGDHIPVNLTSVVVNEGSPNLKVNSGTIDVTAETAIDETSSHNIKIMYDETSGLIRIKNIPESCIGLSVYNITGQKIYHTTQTGKVLQINVSDWNRGIYIIQVVADKNVCKKIKF